MQEIYELKFHHDLFQQGDWRVLVEHDYMDNMINFYINHKDYGTYMFCFGIAMENQDDPNALIEHCFDANKLIYKAQFFDEGFDKYEDEDN